MYKGLSVSLPPNPDPNTLQTTTSPDSLPFLTTTHQSPLLRRRTILSELSTWYLSLTLSTLTLGLAALSTALPSSKRSHSSSKFSFSLNAEGYTSYGLTLNALNSGNLGNLDLVFERPSAYPGTPAYFNQTDLDFDAQDPTLPQSDGTYNMYFEDAGDNYGYAVPVTAIFAAGKPGFSIASDGTLAAPRTEALQSFYACNGTSNGVDLLVLKWGVPKADGSAPDDCMFAQLRQVFNVEE